MSGNWATGNDFMVSRPANTIMIASTVAKIGRSIKNFENIASTFYIVINSFYRHRLDWHSVAHLKKRRCHITGAGSDAFGNDAQ